jgi:hypothetical protein
MRNQKEIEALREQLTKVNYYNDQMNRENLQSQAQLDESESLKIQILGEKDKEIESLQNLNSSLNDRIEDLRKDIQKLGSTNKEISQYKQETYKELERYKILNSDLNQKNSELLIRTNELQSAHAKDVSQRNLTKSLESQLEAAGTANGELRNMIFILEKSKEDLIIKNSLDTEENSRSLQKDLASKDAALTENLTKIRYLEEKNLKIDRLERDVLKWKNSYEETKQKVNELVSMNKKESYRFYENQCKIITEDYEQIIGELRTEVTSLKDTKKQSDVQHGKYFLFPRIQSQ